MKLFKLMLVFMAGAISVLSPTSVDGHEYCTAYKMLFRADTELLVGGFWAKSTLSNIRYEFYNTHITVKTRESYSSKWISSRTCDIKIVRRALRGELRHYE